MSNSGYEMSAMVKVHLKRQDLKLIRDRAGSVSSNNAAVGDR